MFLPRNSQLGGERGKFYPMDFIKKKKSSLEYFYIFRYVDFLYNFMLMNDMKQTFAFNEFYELLIFKLYINWPIFNYYSCYYNFYEPRSPK